MVPRLGLPEPFTEHVHNETALKPQMQRECTDMKFLHKLVNGFNDCPALMGELIFKVPIAVIRQRVALAIGNYSSFYTKI